MAWIPLHLRFVGTRPLVMHSGQLADPLNEFTKALQKVSHKRHKTEADHRQMARLEYLGSLWLAGEPLHPIIPDEAVLACLHEGARKTRNGPAVRAGVICEHHAVLEYKGPTSAEQLWERAEFQLRANVRVRQNRIVRTRPIFRSWSAAVTVEYEDSLLDDDQLLAIAARAGFEVGIGDWRPRYGRFRVERT